MLVFMFVLMRACTRLCVRMRMCVVLDLCVFVKDEDIGFFRELRNATHKARLGR